jgi:hypothetical protein
MGRGPAKNKNAALGPRLLTLCWLLAASQPKQPSSANTAWVGFIKLKKKLKASGLSFITGAS